MMSVPPIPNSRRVSVAKEKKYKLGLALLWIVRWEPSPSDVMFIWSWLSRLIRKKRPWPLTPAVVVLILFMLLNVVQVALAISLFSSLKFALITTYSISLALLFSSPSSFATWYGFRKSLLVSIWIATGIILLLSLMTVIGFENWLPWLYYDASRAEGFFKDPNVTGPFIVIGALCSLCQIIFAKNRALLVHVMGFILAVMAIIFTFSRGALLNLGVGVLSLGGLSLYLKRSIKYSFAVLAGLGFLILFLPYALDTLGQTSRFQGPTQYDLKGRLGAWESGLLIAKDHPWGIGPGQFEVYSPEYQLMLSGRSSDFLTPSAHNLYLRVLAENGVPGLTIFLIAIFSLARPVRNVLRFALQARAKRIQAETAWLISSVLGCLAEGFVIDTLHWRHFWILMGFMIAYTQLIDQHLAHTKAPRMRDRVMDTSVA